MAVQQNPPHCVELIMLVLAMVLLSLALLGLVRDWPYFVLSFSFAIGAAVSCLVREAIAPSPNASVAQVSATVLLLLSCYGFVDWFHHAQPF